MNLALATNAELETVIIDDAATLEDVYYAKQELKNRKGDGNE